MSNSVSTTVLPPEIWSLISEKLSDINSIINLSLTCSSIGTTILNDLKYILKQNPNISLQIIFLKAIEENKIEFATYLLDYVDITSNNNWPLNLYLIFSSQNGYLEIVKLLLEKGADVTYFNTAALRKASKKGHADVVKLLLEYGADPKAKYNEALCEASENGHLEVVRLLLNNSADVNINNPLQCASNNGHLDVVKLLLENGADFPVHKNWPLRCASKKGHLEVVELLKRYTKE